VVLHTELLVRENEIALLGFCAPQERELYRLLIKVDGVGPKMALAALGALSLEDLVQALRGRDVKLLTRIPGVGRKTAEKMCFELSEKMGGLSGLDGLAGATAGDPWEESLRSALTNLGFKEDAVLPVVAELRAVKPPLAEAIRQALKALQR
jgi:Holliday junction DNA helicase RuvA